MHQKRYRNVAKTWTEALNLAKEARIVDWEQPQGGQAVLLLRDPAGQELRLFFAAIAQPALKGDILCVASALTIQALVEVTDEASLA